MKQRFLMHRRREQLCLLGFFTRPHLEPRFPARPPKSTPAPLLSRRPGARPACCRRAGPSALSPTSSPAWACSPSTSVPLLPRPFLDDSLPTHTRSGTSFPRSVFPVSLLTFSHTESFTQTVSLSSSSSSAQEGAVICLVH